MTAGGHIVYGASFSGVMGYRDNSTSGIATGSQPEGMYMVISATHFNSGCCFDYGNAETNNRDNGNGRMDAVYFGTLCWFSPCNGSGPWVMADLENGLFQIRHQADNAFTSVVSSGSSALDKADASWIIRRGLANNSCVSFESRNYPGDFLRHQNFQLFRQPMDGSALFRQDATFCPRAGQSGQGTSFASLDFPARFIRHFNNTLYIASNGGSNAFDATANFAADVSWAVSAPWTP